MDCRCRRQVAFEGLAPFPKRQEIRQKQSKQLTALQNRQMKYRQSIEVRRDGRIYVRGLYLASVICPDPRVGGIKR